MEAKMILQITVTEILKWHVLRKWGWGVRKGPKEITKQQFPFYFVSTWIVYPQGDTLGKCTRLGFQPSQKTGDGALFIHSVVLFTKSCPALCNPMDCSILGFPVLHSVLKFAQFMSTKSVMLSYHLILCHCSVFCSTRGMVKGLA